MVAVFAFRTVGGKVAFGVQAPGKCAGKAAEGETKESYKNSRYNHYAYGINKSLRAPYAMQKCTPRGGALLAFSSQAVLVILAVESTLLLINECR